MIIDTSRQKFKICLFFPKDSFFSLLGCIFNIYGKWLDLEDNAMIHLLETLETDLLRCRRENIKFVLLIAAIIFKPNESVSLSTTLLHGTPPCDLLFAQVFHSTSVAGQFKDSPISLKYLKFFSLPKRWLHKHFVWHLSTACSPPSPVTLGRAAG